MQSTRKKSEKSGGHARHEWSFCNQKYHVQLMMDWYNLKVGDNTNPYSKRYFEAKQLNEEAGEAFGTPTTELEQESADCDDYVSLSSVRKRKRQRRVGGRPKSKTDEALEELVEWRPVARL